MQQIDIVSAITGFFLALLLVSVVGSSLGRALASILSNLFRRLTWPFRLLARIFRPPLRRSRQSRQTAAATAANAASHGRAWQNEIDRELAVEDAAPGVPPFDLDDIKAGLKHEGLVFRSIQVKPVFLQTTLTLPFTEDVAAGYLSEAQRFFGRPVRLSSNPAALHEDVNGAFIISMFRRYDRRAFYLLNEFRKSINGNMRRLGAIFAFLLVAYAVGLLSVLFGAETAFLPAALSPETAPQRLAAAGALSAVTALLFVGWQSAGYQKHQQHNSRELRSFLTRYLGRIADRYREATTKARGVTVGRETNASELAQNARKWHKIMIWLPFRTFFMEHFIRDVLYQVRRNQSYYTLFIPTGLVAAATVFGVTLWQIHTRTGGQPMMAYAAAGGAFVLVAGAYLMALTKVVVEEELTSLDWLGYETLDVSEAMDEVVGGYAEDIGFWKSRLERDQG